MPVTFRPGRASVTAACVANRGCGYSSRANRHDRRRRGIRAVIPRKRNERGSSQPNPVVYRERNRIERLANRLKQYRRIATRYEKRADNYAAFVMLAAVRIWV